MKAGRRHSGFAGGEKEMGQGGREVSPKSIVSRKGILPLYRHLFPAGSRGQISEEGKISKDPIVSLSYRWNH